MKLFCYGAEQTKMYKTLMQNLSASANKPRKTILSLQAFKQEKNMFNKIISFVFLSSFLTSNSFSQEIEQDTIPVKELSEVVVSVSRTDKKINEVGRSITYFSNKDIKNSGVNSVAELLSLAEGVYITGTTQDFGANQSLFIRGANSNQSLVMVDGIPLLDPSTPGNALDLSELSLTDIDHVEIVKGSHSTLYGSSAIGGVINIITNKKMKNGLNMNVRGGAGVFGKETSLFSQNIDVNYTCKGGFYSAVNFNNVNVNGIDATVDTALVDLMPRDKDGMNRFDYGGKLGYKSKMFDVYVSGRNTEKISEIDNREYTDDDNYTLNFSRSLLSYGVKCNVDSNFSIGVNGAQSSFERVSLNDSSIVDESGTYDHQYYKGTYSGKTFINDLQLHYKQRAYNIVIGGGINEQKMDQQVYSYYHGFIWEGSLDTLNLISSTNSFFVLADLNGSIISNKAKGFTLSLGGRSNKNNTFGTSTTYQINPMMKISDKASVYANISSGYNAPSLYQLHSPDRDFVSTITRGNVNLLPERSITKEFGINQQINEHAGIRIAYFQTVVKDVIEYVYLWNKNTSVQALTFWDYRGDTYLNLGTLTTEGIEFEAKGAIGKKLFVSGNFSFLRGKQLNSYESIDTVKTQGNHVQLYSTGKFVSEQDVHTTGLTRRPVVANVSLTYVPASKVFFKVIMKSVSKRNDVMYNYKLGPYGALDKTSVQAYTLFDLIAGVHFSENISALLRVENIGNTTYSEIRGFASRGRGIFFNISYSF
jgi:vitamin B12 transporter